MRSKHFSLQVLGILLLVFPLLLPTSLFASKVFNNVKADLKKVCNGSKQLKISTISDLSKVGILKFQRIGKAKFSTKNKSIYITGEMGVGEFMSKNSKAYKALADNKFIGKNFANSLLSKNAHVILTITDATSVASGKDLLWNITWIMDKATWKLKSGGHFDFNSLTICYANRLQALKKSDMPSNVASKFKIFAATGNKLTLKKDVSLFAQATMQGSKAQKVLGKLIPALDGKASLVFNTNLTWPLNQIALRFQIPGKIDLGKGFKVTPPALVMVLPSSKSPLMVGVDMILTALMPTKSTPMNFKGQVLVPVSVGPTDKGIQFLLAMSGKEKPWADAMGIKGLTIHDLKFMIQLNKIGKNIGFHGKFNIGKHLMELAGMIPPNGIGDYAMSGKLDRISLKDIFGWMASMNKGLKKFIGKLPLSKIIFKNMQMSISTVENRTLGLTDGITMTADLEIFGQKAAGVEVRTLKTKTKIAKIITGYYYKAWVHKFKMGKLEIDGTGPDMKYGTKDDGPSFENKVTLLTRTLGLSGRMSLFGSFYEVTFSYSMVEASGKVEIKIANKFNVLLEIAYSINPKRPNFRFHGKFKQDFYKYLTDATIAALKKAQKKASAQERAGKAALTKAQKKVNKLNKNIKAREKSFKKEQKKAQSKLNGAKKKVDGIKKNIKAREKSFKKEQKKAQSKLNGAKSKVRSAQNKVHKLKKKYKKAKKELKHCHWYRKADKAAKVAAIATAKKSAELALKGVQKILNGVKKVVKIRPLKADPKYVSLIAARKTALFALNTAKKAVALRPLKADPKYIALIAAKKTAWGALELAKKSVGLYGNVSQICLRFIEKIVKKAATFDIKYIEFDTRACAKTTYFKLNIKMILDGKTVKLKNFGFDFSRKKQGENTIKLLKTLFSKASDDAKKVVKYLN